jgi:hypothetical protein
MKNGLRLALMATPIVIGLGFVNCAEAKPAGKTSTGSMSVTATMNYTLDNYASPGNMTPPEPTADAINAALANPANAGKTVTLGPSPNSFKLYSNVGTVPLQIVAVNTMGSSGTSTNTAQLQGSANPTEVIKYHINYTPCNGGMPIDLAGCTAATGCTLNSKQSECASAQAPNGTVNYTYEFPADVLADDYQGGTSLTYSIGM